MQVTVTTIAGRKFIHFGTYCSVPVDRIKSFDFKFDVCEVITDDPNEEIRFTDVRCFAIREFLSKDS